MIRDYVMDEKTLSKLMRKQRNKRFQSKKREYSFQRFMHIAQWKLYMLKLCTQHLELEPELKAQIYWLIFVFGKSKFEKRIFAFYLVKILHKSKCIRDEIIMIGHSIQTCNENMLRKHFCCFFFFFFVSFSFCYQHN